MCANIYLINLQPKRFRLSASSEVYNQKNENNKATLFTFYKRNMNRKKEMPQKTKLNKTIPFTGTIEFKL